MQLSDTRSKPLCCIHHAYLLDVVDPANRGQVELVDLRPVQFCDDVARVHVFDENAHAACHKIAVRSCENDEKQNV